MTPYEAAEVMGALDAEDLKAIKHRFRQLAKQHHPDKSKAPDAHQTFVRILNAFEVLEKYASQGGSLPLRHDDGSVEEAATVDDTVGAAGVVSVYAPMSFEELMEALRQDHAIVHVVGQAPQMVNASPRARSQPAAAEGALMQQRKGEFELQDAQRTAPGTILVYGEGLGPAVRRALARGEGSVALPSNTCRKEANSSCTYGACTARIQGKIAYVNGRPYVLIVMP